HVCPAFRHTGFPAINAFVVPCGQPAARASDANDPCNEVSSTATTTTPCNKGERRSTNSLTRRYMHADYPHRANRRLSRRYRESREQWATVTCHAAASTREA